MTNKKLFSIILILMIAFISGCSDRSNKGTLGNSEIYNPLYTNFAYGNLTFDQGVKWEKQLVPETLLTSNPVVYQGTIYIGTEDKLYTYDNSTGDHKWTFKGGPRQNYTPRGLSSPAFSEDTVYLGGNDGYLYALDNQSGTKKWQFKTPNYFVSAPLIRGEFIYFTSFNEVSDEVGYLFALNKKNGQVKWKYQVYMKYGAALTAPVITNNTIYFGDYGGNLHALDLKKGKEKWSIQTPEKVMVSQLTAGKEYLFLGSGQVGGNFYAIDKDNGKIIWKHKSQGGVASPLTFKDEMVYFFDKDLYALDIKTGQVKWSYPANSYNNGYYNFPILTGDIIYLSTEEGVVAVDRKNGQEKWKFATGDRLSFSPGIDEKGMYLLDDSAKLYALF